jgi:hypothetical protein
VFFHLHAQYLSLPWNEADFNLFSWGVVIFFDHVGMKCRDGKLNCLALFFALHLFTFYNNNWICK